MWYCAGDSLSAIYGVQVLNEIGIHPAVISGRFTMSQLLIREVQQHMDFPILTIDEIMTGQFNQYFINKHVVAA